MKYRKKPVVIDAWQFTHDTKDQCFNNCRSSCYADFGEDGEPILVVQTIDGNEATIEIGDFLVKGVQGEFYPCKPDIFYATYELVGGKP